MWMRPQNGDFCICAQMFGPLEGLYIVGILLKVTIRWLQCALTISMDESIVFAMRRLELENGLCINK
jgi:hypothetical protein